MKWKKLGKIFEVNKNHNWMYSYSAVPFAENIINDVFKIYFSSRNKNNESSIGYIIIDINHPNIILDISKKAVLSKGDLGTFDDSGAMGSCILNKNSKKYLYYIGWNLGKTVPFRNAIGLAISTDKGRTYKKLFDGPILDRTKEEPHFTTSNCTIEDNGVYKTWYSSCTKWSKLYDIVTHHYHIKYATSLDGINWDRKNQVAIDFKDEFEYAISVPRVIKEYNQYKMWFSSRGTKDISTYRIRYAESDNGIDWIRKDDEVGIDVSTEGWDSEMICYPFVFDHKGKRYMLYNGNDYGKTGFGLAVLEEK
ncbi:MAG: hypothetical protein QS721_04790 [Candidatus Endonucleobacter sp. (ex Gigantidas childressi)]|nr:hypothetical protein [Candidatus Endonucleobacter sp. (ex Gigantidas childressi)]